MLVTSAVPAVPGTYVVTFGCNGRVGQSFSATSAPFPIGPPVAVCAGGIRFEAEAMVVASGSAPLTNGGTSRLWSAGPSALNFGPIPAGLTGSGTFRVTYSGGGKRTLFETNPIRQFAQQTFPQSAGFTTVSTPITIRPTATYSWSFDTTVDSGTMTVDYVEFCP